MLMRWDWYRMMVEHDLMIITRCFKNFSTFVWYYRHRQRGGLFWWLWPFIAKRFVCVCVLPLNLIKIFNKRQFISWWLLQKATHPIITIDEEFMRWHSNCANNKHCAVRSTDLNNFSLLCCVCVNERVRWVCIFPMMETNSFTDSYQSYIKNDFPCHLLIHLGHHR